MSQYPDDVPVSKDNSSSWLGNLKGMLMYCDETASMYMDAILYCGYVGLTDEYCKLTQRSMLLGLVIIVVLMVVTPTFRYCCKKPSLR